MGHSKNELVKNSQEHLQHEIGMLLGAAQLFPRLQLGTAFASALTRAGIKGFRFHDLRHTFASHYMMRAGQLYDLKETLGHSDVKMTARYAHLSPAHLRAGVDALDGLTGGHTDGHKVLESGPAQDTAPRNSARKQIAPVAQVDRAAVS